MHEETRLPEAGEGEGVNLVKAVVADRVCGLSGDEGMSTVEYAIGTIAAAAFGALLYSVVTGDSILAALTGLIQRALSTAV